MRYKRVLLSGLSLLLIAFVLGAWKLLIGNNASENTNSIGLDSSHATICDEFLSALPPPGPARMEAGRPCVEALPSLPLEDQRRIANYYTTQLPDFIARNELGELIAELDPEAALPFRALNMRHVVKGDYQAEIDAARHLVREAEAAANQAALVNALFAELLIPVIAGNLDAFDDAKMEAALAIAAHEDMRGQEPYLRNLWALAHNLRGNYAESISNYQAARQGFERNKNYSGMSMALTNLSYIYSEFQDNEKAIKLARSAINVLDEHNIEAPDKRAAAMIALGEHLSAAQLHEQALEIFNTLVDYSELENIPILESTLMAQFRALDKSGDTQKAYDLYADRVTSGYFPKDSFARLEVFAFVAARSAELGYYDDAKYYFDIVVRSASGPSGDEPYIERILSNSGNEHSALIIGQDLLLSAIASGEREDAIEIAQVLDDLRKDHVKNSKIKAIAGHELQTTIDALGLEAERNALALQSSRQQLLLAALSALALGIIAVIAYRSFRTQKRLTAEKNRYLDEIHHRTKNNFQLLSSLLNMDIRRSGVFGKNEGRRLDAVNRLQTMALVHDHIYNLDASKGTTANLSEFVDDLLALIDTSLGRDDIKLEWSVEGGEMDVTQLTPFGLMLCELVTNSYKHAFPDKGGAITIDIVEEEGTRKMTLKDNGKGFDVATAKNKPGSLGIGLIFDLADQVGGKLTVASDASGTVWTFK